MSDNENLFAAITVREIGPDDVLRDDTQQGRYDLELTFANQSQGQRHSRLVFGTDPGCEIAVSPETRSAPVHFDLSLDNLGQLVLTDLGSNRGTGVTYQRDWAENEALRKDARQGRLNFHWPSKVMVLPDVGSIDQTFPFRSNFTWVVGGNSFLDTQNVHVHVLFGSTSVAIKPLRNVNPSTSDALQTRQFLLLGVNPPGPDVCSMYCTGRPLPSMPGIMQNQQDFQLKTLLCDDSVNWKIAHCWDAVSGTMQVVKQSKRAQARAGPVNWIKEVYALGRCDHENIISLLDYSRVPSQDPWIQLEYAPWSSLDLQSRASALADREVVSVLKQCLSALNYLHDNAMVHRNIEPASIFVMDRIVDAKRGNLIRVKLGSFGYATASHDPDGTTNSKLKVYQAPEVRKNQDVYGPKADVFSLGIVISSFVLEKCWQGKRGLVWRNEIEKLVSFRFQVDSGETKKVFAVLKDMIEHPLKGRLSSHDAHGRAVSL